jgi:hypothetical protein
VAVELSPVSGGGAPVTDFVSADGAGAQRRLRAIVPGRYTLRLISPLLAQHPLILRPVVEDGQTHETAAFGAICLSIAPERSFEVARAFELTVVAEPSRAPVFRGTLAAIEATDVTGRAHPRALLIPFGSYSYGLVDRSPDPTIGFVSAPKGKSPELSGNRVDLTPERPVVVVDLARLIRLDDRRR